MLYNTHTVNSRKQHYKHLETIRHNCEELGNFIIKWTWIALSKNNLITFQRNKMHLKHFTTNWFSHNVPISFWIMINQLSSYRYFRFFLWLLFLFLVRHFRLFHGAKTTVPVFIFIWGNCYVHAYPA